MDGENQFDSNNQQVFSDSHQVDVEFSDAVEKKKRRSGDRHRQVHCPICFTVMRCDKLKRHSQTHKYILCKPECERCLL